MRKHVVFAIIPPRLTGLLQPLDVALNRSFQQFFNDRNDEYQSESLANDTNKTHKGNVKIPSTEIMTGWVVQWCEGVDVNAVKKAFKLCGLVAPEDFNPDEMHQALKDVFDRSINMDEWVANHGSVIDSSRVVPDDNWLEFKGKHSLLKAWHHAVEVKTDFKEWSRDLLDDMKKLLSVDAMTSVLFTKEDSTHVTDGLSLTQGRFEGYAISKSVCFVL